MLALDRLDAAQQHDQQRRRHCQLARSEKRSPVPDRRAGCGLLGFPGEFGIEPTHNIFMEVGGRVDARHCIELRPDTSHGIHFST